MEHVVRGKLKLKGGSKLKASHDKKKHKKKKSKQSKTEDASPPREKEDDEVVIVNSLTPAQRRYEEHRKKREEEDIEKAAGKTYRERVEELNQYLGRLTEHHDVPRVSAAGNG
ncbi:hypothetical protein Poli38472_002050 [Pythium oligandrum]|uniref:Uncharacterized protein n=1 Tax=Pythium oligandrum TaxID=41045 RepID=A0A8K1CHF1_PYTOL|nr:hypothetical protein Poli38472_002050 [Pythium oligandrum]|eukprot:TMW63109.1 hypothetical protein Poli38472_002050 [Pythium oligandrum]